MSSTKKKLSRSSNDLNKKQNDTMQQDEEMRSRYREYRGESRDHLNPKVSERNIKYDESLNCGNFQTSFFLRFSFVFFLCLMPRNNEINNFR